MAYQAGTPKEPDVLAQTISANIQKITVLTAELQRGVALLGTEHDSAQLRQQLQQGQQQGSLLAKETDRHIKQLAVLPVGADQRQRKLQRERLLSDFSSALVAFQRIQREAADMERGLVARARASSSQSGSRVSGGQFEDGFEGIPSPFQSNSQAEAQAEKITEEDLQLIQERETSIRQLESDITDINDIFKDLAVMVHEQGDVIDSIEANVENADISVQSGTQQLAQAAAYQRSSRKKICILLVVLVVVAVIAGLIIWGATKG
ncbi:syntaxin-7-like [Aplochiton taeniatus]